MIQIIHQQEASETVRTLASMKSFLEDSLDRRAPEKAGEWGSAWMEYRKNGGDLASVLPHLPKWVQVQYQQLAMIHRFVRTSQEAVRRLEAEAADSYHEGIKAGQRAHADRTDHLWRERWTLGELLNRLPVFPQAMRTLRSRELQRAATTELAKATWPQLY